MLRIRNCIRPGNYELAAETKKEAYEAARRMFTPDSHKFALLEEIRLK